MNSKNRCNNNGSNEMQKQNCLSAFENQIKIHTKYINELKYLHIIIHFNITLIMICYVYFKCISTLQTYIYVIFYSKFQELLDYLFSILNEQLQKQNVNCTQNENIHMYELYFKQYYKHRHYKKK